MLCLENDYWVFMTLYLLIQITKLWHILFISYYCYGVELNESSLPSEELLLIWAPGLAVCWIFIFGFHPSSCSSPHIWTTIPGCDSDCGCNSCASPGVRLAKADNNSTFKHGCASSLGSHPTGGEAGGDIKYCLTGAGGCRCSLEVVFDDVRVG